MDRFVIGIEACLDGVDLGCNRNTLLARRWRMIDGVGAHRVDLRPQRVNERRSVCRRVFDTHDTVTQTLGCQALLHDVERCFLFANHDDAFASAKAIGDDVDDSLTFSGAGRALNDQPRL